MEKWTNRGEITVEILILSLKR